MKLTPILIVIENNVVKTALICTSAEQLEKAFSEECFGYGVEPSENNFDDGYLELENNISVNMTRA